VEFTVTDMGAAKAFYAKAFGWKFTDYGPDYVSFEDGRLTGGLHTRGTVGIPLVIIYALDLGSAERSVTEAGGTVAERHEFPGGRRFHFRDPAGNVLAVWSDK
jgi:hypothetical protein